MNASPTAASAQCDWYDVAVAVRRSVACPSDIRLAFLWDARNQDRNREDQQAPSPFPCDLVFSRSNNVHRHAGHSTGSPFSRTWADLPSYLSRFFRFFGPERPLKTDRHFFFWSGTPVFAFLGFLHFFRQRPLLIVWRDRRAFAPIPLYAIALLLTIDAVRGKWQRNYTLDRNWLMASKARAVVARIKAASASSTNRSFSS
jgi:hypothetical protein